MVFSLKGGKAGDQMQILVSDKDVKVDMKHSATDCTYTAEESTKIRRLLEMVLSRSLLINITSYRICQVLRPLIAILDNLPNFIPAKYSDHNAIF